MTGDVVESLAEVSFIVLPMRGRAKLAPAGSLHIYLETNGWNDFGYETSFGLSVATARDVTELGMVKILYWPGGADAARETAKHLPQRFRSLDHTRYGSLGQSVDYYTFFRGLGDIGHHVLRSLADVCLREDRDRWTSLEGFTTSLLRGTDAQKAFEEGPSILSGRRDALVDMSFEALIELGAGHTGRISFRLDGTPPLPRRVFVLIGENGTGKTTCLHRLAETLFPDGGEQQRVGVAEAHRLPKQPARSFSRGILVSTSPFDAAKRPREKTLKSYRYVGLRWRFESVLHELARFEEQQARESERDFEKAWLEWLRECFATPDKLRARLSARTEPSSAHLEVLADRRQDWAEILAGVLQQDQLEHLRNDLEAEWPKLSSGQQALVTVLAGLAAELDEESLVLIDEPETHLHPRYLSLYMVALQKLLAARNSYAVIATHDPHVLADVPTDSVGVMAREEPYVRPLFLQSFGATLPALTQDVFRMMVDDAHWFAELQRLVGEGKTYEGICSLFDPSLEPEARVVLRHLLAEGAPRSNA